MMHINGIKIAVLLRSTSLSLKKRLIFPQAYSTFSERKNDMVDKIDQVEDVNCDKPIQFSTSKAATHPASYSIAFAKQYPKRQPDIIALCVTVLLVYFCILREENDIDEAIVANMSPEIVEQIYGKHEKSIRKN